MSFADEWDDLCRTQGRPERIEVLMSDINGILRGKWIAGDQAAKIGKGQVRIPFSTCAVSIRGHEVSETGLGIVVGDPDGVLVPVPGTLVPVPWAPRPTAQVLCDIEEVPGTPSDLSPRTLLAGVLARFEARGWHPVVAAELEFYVLRGRPARDAAPEPPEFTPPAQNYDMEVMDRAQPWLDDLLVACAAQGLATDTVTAEYGPAQFEINFHHGPALPAADQALLFRRAVRGVAARHGLEATFMAKPYAEEPGNGFHVHASVVDATGANIFDQPGDPGPMLSRAVAGTLDSLRDLQAIFAPHMNSFRRFGPMSFAPTAPEWGRDHRGAAIRMAATSGPAARLEHRIAGADANPYLVMAAVLGGMLHGIDTDPHLPDEIGGATAPAPLSAHWAAALDRFALAGAASEIFGPRFVTVFEAVKRREIEELTTVIPAHEYGAYLSRL